MNPEQALATRAQRTTQLQNKQQLDRLTSLEKTLVSSMRQLVQFLDGKITKTEVVNQLKSIATPDVDKVVVALEKLDSNITSSRLDITPLTKGIDALEKQLKSLPKDLPEQQHVDVSKSYFDSLEKTIKALKLDPKIKVDAPKVDVRPELHVDAPDLKPLQKSLLDVVTAIKTQQFPTTDVSTVEKHLEEANKKLQKIVEKPVGGGGGGGSGTSFKDTTGKLVYVELTADGSIPVTVKNSLTPNVDFDYIDIQQTSATVETYVYKQGGVSGTTVQTITVTYTDSTKNDLDKVEYS